MLPIMNASVALLLHVMEMLPPRHVILATINVYAELLQWEITHAPQVNPVWAEHACAEQTLVVQ